MRQSWSDDRLDGLSERVDLGFKHVDERFDLESKKVDERFEQVDWRLEQIDKRFDRIEAGFAETNVRFDHLQQTIMVTGGGIIATLIATCVAAIAG